MDIPGYTVLGPLGQGGMSTVVLAEQQSLRRRVALKFMLPGLAHEPLYRERFLREARLAAQLHHPNIVAIHDVGEHAGVPYIAMAYEPGGTVHELMATPIRTERALRVVRDVALALDYAHRHGVVHRDVKPENILCRRDGSCLLSDFGIAAAVEAQGVLTREGANVGTPGYMSPEQLRGDKLDGRSDLYGLGVVLYRMLAGRLPFQGSDGWATGLQHLYGDIPRLPEAHAAVQGLIDNLLAKDPNWRLPNGAAVVAHIDALLSGRVPPATVLSAPVERRASRRSMRLALLLAVLSLGVLALVWYWQRGARPLLPDGAATVTTAATTAVPATIAVLPFADLSVDNDQAHLADGLSEELINALAQISGLRVAGRTSSFAYRAGGKSTAEIARELGVSHLLEGSVRREQAQLRVSVRLLNAQTGYPVWSETYQRQLDDVLQIQDEIAGSVAQALQLRLAARRAAPRVGDPSREAYHWYLLGRQFMARGNPQDFADAVDAFGKATELAPDYAAAFAGLVSAQVASLQFNETVADPLQAQAQALTAAERALTLDPDSAEAYAARATLRFTLTWDWPGARSDFERALQLNPSDADALRRFGLLLAAEGQLPRALQLTEAAIKLDPLSASAWNNLGYFQSAVGDFPAARRALDRALEINPQRVSALFNLGVVELLDGKPERALGHFQKIADGSPFRLCGEAMVQHRLGHTDAAAAAMLALRQHPQVSPFWLAAVHAQRGEQDEAFAALRLALARRDYFVKQARFDPLLQPLHGDPQYTRVLEELGLGGD